MFDLAKYIYIGLSVDPHSFLILRVGILERVRGILIMVCFWICYLGVSPLVARRSPLLVPLSSPLHELALL